MRTGLSWEGNRLIVQRPGNPLAASLAQLLVKKRWTPLDVGVVTALPVQSGCDVHSSLLKTPSFAFDLATSWGKIHL